MWFAMRKQSILIRWAHAPGKFFDLHQAIASPMVLETLACIGQLYQIEERIFHLAKATIDGIETVIWFKKAIFRVNYTDS